MDKLTICKGWGIISLPSYHQWLWEVCLGRSEYDDGGIGLSPAVTDSGETVLFCPWVTASHWMCWGGVFRALQLHGFTLKPFKYYSNSLGFTLLEDH